MEISIQTHIHFIIHINNTSLHTNNISAKLSPETPPPPFSPPSSPATSISVCSGPPGASQRHRLYQSTIVIEISQKQIEHNKCGAYKRKINFPKFPPKAYCLQADFAPGHMHRHGHRPAFWGLRQRGHSPVCAANRKCVCDESCGTSHVNVGGTAAARGSARVGVLTEPVCRQHPERGLPEHLELRRRRRVEDKNIAQ